MVSNPNPNPYPIYIHLFAIYRDIHKCYYLLNILTCGTPYIWSCKIKLSIVLKFAHLKGNLLHVLCSSVNIHSTIELTTAIWLIFLQLRHAFGYGCRKPGWKHAMKTCITWTIKYIRLINMVIVKQKCAQPALFSSRSQEAQVLPMCNSINRQV